MKKINRKRRHKAADIPSDINPLRIRGALSRMAEACGCNRSAICRIMNGIRRPGRELLVSMMAYCRKHRIPLYERDFIHDARRPIDIVQERGNYAE